MAANAGRFAGRVAVVTGGASGIGEQTVRRFVADGACCVVADVDVDRATALVAEIGDQVAFVRTDVTSDSDVSAAMQLAVDRFGSLDCVFNNAGVVGALGSIVDVPPTSWERTIAIHLTGAFLGCKHGARIMRERGSGSIVNSASVAGLRGGFGAHPYSAAKAGIIGLTMSVAAELAPFGVRVNAVAPGTVVTPLISNLGMALTGQTFSDDAAAAMAAESSPLKRAGRPDDVASAVLFLSGDDASNITGQVIVVDGGSLSAPAPAALVGVPAMDLGLR